MLNREAWSTDAFAFVSAKVVAASVSFDKARAIFEEVGTSSDLLLDLRRLRKALRVERDRRAGGIGLRGVRRGERRGERREDRERLLAPLLVAAGGGLADAPNSDPLAKDAGGGVAGGAGLLCAAAVAFAACSFAASAFACSALSFIAASFSAFFLIIPWRSY